MYSSTISHADLPVPAGSLLYPVLTGTGIRREVTDIRVVHHVSDPVALRLECPSQDILEHVRTQVADVGKVVDGGTAGVQSDLGRPKGFEMRTVRL